ncbi:MAG: hypothetical protein LBK99_26955 [Opitutaceae bacterium]|jgi:hypothetical protein|nr:hypothetical protein [Opitutaceae bacterium]
MRNLSKTIWLFFIALLLGACASGNTRGKYFDLIFTEPSSLRQETKIMAVGIAEAFKGYGFQESYASDYTPDRHGEFGRLILNDSGRHAAIFFDHVRGNTVKVSVLADKSLLHDNRFSELLTMIRASCESLATAGKAKWKYEEGGESFIK